MRTLLRAALHPRTALLLLRAAWRFRARDWYRRAPFLPLPPAEYLEWRWHTAYGDDGAGPTAGELRRYLAWTVAMRRRGASTRGGRA
ncbi:MAG TPA: hypothetical protein VF158_11205 [Longimicrobiales bacterium]